MQKYFDQFDGVISTEVGYANEPEKSPAYSIMELGRFEVLYPFKYTVSKEYLINNEQFLISNFGGEATISLKEK